MCTHTQRQERNDDAGEIIARVAHLRTHIIHFAASAHAVDREIEESEVCGWQKVMHPGWLVAAWQTHHSLTHPARHRICMQIALARLLCTRRPPRNRVFKVFKVSRCALVV